MRVGDKLVITRDEFIRLAPLGLVVKISPCTYFFYYPTYVDTNEYYTSDSTYTPLQGYCYGSRVGSPQGLLFGFWAYLLKPVTIISLPRQSLYRRT